MHSLAAGCPRVSPPCNLLRARPNTKRGQNSITLGLSLQIRRFILFNNVSSLLAANLIMSRTVSVEIGDPCPTRLCTRCTHVRVLVPHICLCPFFLCPYRDISVSVSLCVPLIMNCIFIVLLQVLKALYNGSFIHTLGGEAGNSQRQRPHFPHSHTNGGKLTPTNTLEGM